MSNENWQPIAVEHVVKLVIEAGKPVERPHTICVLRNANTGDMKQFTMLGTFTVEQLRAKEAAK